MATQAEQIIDLNLKYGILETNIHGRLEAIDSKLQVLLEGTGGHDKEVEYRIRRLEEQQSLVATTLGLKADKDSVSTQVDAAAKAVVALAVVDAKKIEDAALKALSVRISGLYFIIVPVAMLIITASIKMIFKI